MARRGKDGSSTFVMVQKCEYDGCKAWHQPGHGMQKHINRVHGLQTPQLFLDIQASQGVHKSPAKHGSRKEKVESEPFGTGLDKVQSLPQSLF
jgi:hypothetical protein